MNIHLIRLVFGAVLIFLLFFLYTFVESIANGDKEAIAIASTLGIAMVCYLIGWIITLIFKVRDVQ